MPARGCCLEASAQCSATSGGAAFATACAQMASASAGVSTRCSWLCSRHVCHTPCLAIFVALAP
eukprot:6471987-Amphidinium_carterae.1